MKFEKSPTSSTDRLCATALTVLLAATVWVYETTDGAAIRAAEADKPSAITITTPDIDWTPLLEAVEAQRAELFWRDVPLDQELQVALRDACEAHGVPVSLALGLIEVESGFQADVVSREGAYGLCQLNPKYFPADLDPAGNIAAGVARLGELLERYGDTAAALTAYNSGRDTGVRRYASAVLAAAERWEDQYADFKVR